MTNNHAIIGAFPSHAEANSAVLELQKTGFDIKKLSLAKTILPPSSNADFLPGRIPSSIVGLTFVLLASGNDEDTHRAQEILQAAGYLTREAIQDTGIIEGGNVHPPHPPGARPLHPAGIHPPHPSGVRPPHPSGVHPLE